MTFIKGTFLAVASLIVALVGAVVIAEIYRRLRYPGFPVAETDVFFDLGLVFLLGFAVTFSVSIVGCVLWHRRRRAVATNDTRV